MRKNVIIQLERLQTESDTTLLEIPNSELLTTLNNIRSLQTTLYRLASILDGKSTEILSSTHLALKKLSSDIIQVLAHRYMQNNREALQNWENEGGKVDYPSF